MQMKFNILSFLLSTILISAESLRPFEPKATFSVPLASDIITYWGGDMNSSLSRTNSFTMTKNLSIETGLAYRIAPYLDIELFYLRELGDVSYNTMLKKVEWQNSDDPQERYLLKLKWKF